MTTLNDKIKQVAGCIEWITNAATKLTINGKIVYIDPWKLTKTDKADLILITHAHYDHFSPNDIKLIATPQTTIVCTADVAKQTGELNVLQTITVKPFDTITWNGLKISTVPMYNVVKDNFHNKSMGWVGYLIEFDGVTIYHAGDTELIPEMKNIKCDIALMPIGQTYTMNSVEEAAEAILTVQAQIVIPIHYDVHESKPGDVAHLKQLLADKCAVFEQGS